MRRRLRHFLSLPGHDRLLLLQAWLLLLAADLALRLRPGPLLRQGTGGANAAPALLTAAAAADHLRRLVDMAAAVHPLRPTCLRRALTLQWLLRRQGIAADLRIGARLGADGLAAHAWLELDGRPVGEPEDVARTYTPLQRQVRP